MAAAGQKLSLNLARTNLHLSVDLHAHLSSFFSVDPALNATAIHRMMNNMFII